MVCSIILHHYNDQLLQNRSWRVGDACVTFELTDSMSGPLASGQDPLGGVQDVEVMWWGWCMILKWHKSDWRKCCGLLRRIYSGA